MAVRDDFAPGEILTSADLNDTFASKPTFSYGTATPSTTDSGFLWYDSNSTPAAPKFWDGAAFQALTSGKILQVVRATDTANRSTSSTTFVDVTGLSVTITPQKSDSAILLWCVGIGRPFGGTDQLLGYLRIADSSDNAVSGAENYSYETGGLGGTGTRVVSSPFSIVGYATPATTSPVTYKLRFAAGSSVTFQIRGDNNTTQMFAIEVTA
jgi:hypothetical protein